MRDLLRALVGRSPATFTDLRFERWWRSTAVIRGRRLEFSSVDEGETGIVRCLERGHGWGYAAFRDPATADGSVRAAHEFSLALPRRTPLVLAPLTPREVELPCPESRDPRRLRPDTGPHLGRRVAAALQAVDRRVVDVRVRWTAEVREVWVANSEGLLVGEARPALRLTALAVAEEDGTTERATDSLATSGSLADLERWVDGIGGLAERAVARLHAVPVRPGRYPVILGSRVAGVLAHSAIGHRCTADAGPSGPLPLGLRVGLEGLTLGDDPTAPGLQGTMAFDDEGAIPQNCVVVRNGVLVSHLHSRATAGAVGAVSTGHARTTGVGPAVPRLANTYLARGRGDLADLLRPIETGLYLAEPETAIDERGISIRAGLARMIRRGELAEPVKGATLTGDPLGLLGQIESVAGDFAWDVSASRCDVAGQAVPVTMGAPHVRLVEADVGAAG